MIDEKGTSYRLDIELEMEKRRESRNKVRIFCWVISASAMLHGHGIFGPVPVSGRHAQNPCPAMSLSLKKKKKFRHSFDTVDTADPKKIQDFDI